MRRREVQTARVGGGELGRNRIEGDSLANFE
jgi:hypothetical protein